MTKTELIERPTEELISMWIYAKNVRDAEMIERELNARVDYSELIGKLNDLFNPDDYDIDHARMVMGIR